MQEVSIELTSIGLQPTACTYIAIPACAAGWNRTSVVSLWVIYSHLGSPLPVRQHEPGSESESASSHYERDILPIELSGRLFNPSLEQQVLLLPEDS